MTPKHFIWAAALLMAAFLIPALFYWRASHAQWAKCVYGDAFCSLTIATYLLSVIGLATLIAAGYAATFAKRAFDLEREVILSLHACAAECYDGTIQARAIRHDPYLREEWHLKSLAPKNPKFEVGAPDNQNDYVPVDFDCFSIGRSPVVDGILRIRCKSPDGTQAWLPLAIGSVPADRYIHMTLWLSDEVSKFRFYWIDRAIHRSGRGVGAPVRIDLHFSEQEFTRPGVRMTADFRPRERTPDELTVEVPKENDGDG
jgi:hypothetical protein